MAMAAVIPNVKDSAWNEIYDLKGNRDDKILTRSGQSVRRCSINRVWYCIDRHKCHRPTQQTDTYSNTNIQVRAVHMRCWNIPYFCCLSICGCLSKQRVKYYQGKVDAFQGDFFHLTDSAAKLVLERIHNDTKFLAEVGLMDYSIILGVRRCPLKDYKPGVFPKGLWTDPINLIFLFIRVRCGHTTLVLLTSCRNGTWENEQQRV